MLDDLLVAESGPVQHGREAPTHALMGRFGNVLLVNGEPRWEARAARAKSCGSFSRTSRARACSTCRSRGRREVKVVASDLGRYEREAWVESVTIAPAERYVVDVRFDDPGRRATREPRARHRPHHGALLRRDSRARRRPRLGRPASPDPRLVRAPARESWCRGRHRRLRPHLDRPVDHELLVSLRGGDALPAAAADAASNRSTASRWSGQGRCPRWTGWRRGGRSAGRCRIARRGAKTWRSIGASRGDVVKLRLVNDRDALHAMQHPIHIHGQRFLVLSINGVPNDNPSGRTRCWCRPGSSPTCCSTSPTRASGCCTATSPSTSRQACAWSSR